MTIECIHCHARYSIADSLVPPQGARVKCKKCGQVFPIKPPAAEPAPTEMALVPPTPEPVAPPRVPEPVAPPRVPEAVAPPPVPASVTPPPVPASVTPSAPAPAAPPPVPEPSHASVAYEQFVAPAHGGPSPAALAATHAPSATQAEAGHPPAPAAPPPTPAAPEAEAPPSAPPAAAPTPPPSAAPSPATAAPAASTGVPLPAGTPIPEGLSPEERQRHERARRLARVLASDIAIYNREKRDRGIQDGNLVAVLGYEIKKSWDIYKERVGAEFANATPYFRDALNEIVAEGKKVF
ncbi:MAG: zinc-ribbon domain-containing protein [Hyphomicrobiales bacterium]